MVIWTAEKAAKVAGMLFVLGLAGYVFFNITIAIRKEITQEIGI